MGHGMNAALSQLSSAAVPQSDPTIAQHRRQWEDGADLFSLERSWRLCREQSQRCSDIEKAVKFTNIRASPRCLICPLRGEHWHVVAHGWAGGASALGRAKGTYQGNPKHSCATGIWSLPVVPVAKTHQKCDTTSLSQGRTCGIVGTKGCGLGLETRAL